MERRVATDGNFFDLYTMHILTRSFFGTSLVIE
jgi:hypothetical protein